MTCIAYRDGMLAADRLCSDGHIIHGFRKKVFSVDGRIGAASGASEDCVAFRKWVEAGAPDDRKPTLDERFTAILIERDGAVRQFDQKLIEFTLEGPYFAEGDGYAIALGAMYMGATAEDAVKAACAHALGCGGGVDVLRLDAPPALTLVPPAQMAQ